MTKTTRLFAFCLAVLAAGVGLSATSSAHSRVSVSALESSVTEDGSIATARFRIQVVNQEDFAVTALKVVFEGGIEVVIGDITADSTVVSGGQKFMFDTTGMPATRSFPVPVKVKFLIDGVEAEQSSILSLKRAE